jgi:hypothetical protein
MPPETAAALAALMLAAAVLYSMVGHAGASGYLAVMALFGLAPAVMRPTALTLNLCVAAVATATFARAGCFRWPLFWPFALASVPCAYLGGMLHLPAAAYRGALGVVLLFSAVRLLLPDPRADGPARPLPVWLGLLLGAVLGLLSGLTGVGGGIFLSPLLLFARLASPRETAGVSAPFILVNSAAGLLGGRAGLVHLPPAWPWWALAVLVGGVVGARIGARRLGAPAIRRVLAVVLAVAAGKMLLG